MKAWDRFATRVLISNGCWYWTGSVEKGGYGRFWLNGKTVLAHRYAYEHLVGPIPNGLTLDHLCRNPRCVNPAHLEPSTLKENIGRSERATKTHCKRGHPLSGENLYITKRGQRHCVACDKLWSKTERGRESNRERNRRYRLSLSA